MISDEFKFIFIHLPKTAGTSVSGTFGIQAMHLTALESKERYREKWDSYFKWCIVRNPWDRFVSMYHHRQLKGFKEFRMNPDLNFKNWLRHILKDHTRLNRYQLGRITIDNEIALDYVVRFEKLKEGFEYVSNQIGSKLPLRHLNKTHHRHYSYYYDLECIDLVKHVNQDEIDMWGYEFEHRCIKVL